MKKNVHGDFKCCANIRDTRRLCSVFITRLILLENYSVVHFFLLFSVRTADTQTVHHNAVPMPPLRESKETVPKFRGGS